MLRRYALVLLLVAMASGLHGMASQPAVPGLFVNRPDPRRGYRTSPVNQTRSEHARLR